MNRSETLLKLLLRFEAIILMLALPAMFLPTEWMANAHEMLGLGNMPRGKLVEYLTRSLSGVYATCGPLLIFVSLDVRKYASLIAFIAIMRMILALCLLGLDLWIGMPWYWTLAEGPAILGIAFLQLCLARNVERS